MGLSLKPEFNGKLELFCMVLSLLCIGEISAQACPGGLTGSNSEDGQLRFVDYGGLTTVRWLFRFPRSDTLTCCVAAPPGTTATRVWSADGVVLPSETGDSIEVSRTLSRRKMITCAVSAGSLSLTRTFNARGSQSDFTESEPRCPSTPAPQGSGLRFLFEEYDSFNNDPNNYFVQRNPWNTYNVVWCCASEHDRIIWRRNGKIVSRRRFSCAAGGGGHFYDNNQIFAYLAPDNNDPELIECEVIRDGAVIRAGAHSHPFSFSLANGECHDPPRFLGVADVNVPGEGSFVDVSFSAACPWRFIRWDVVNQAPGTNLASPCLSERENFKPALRFSTQSKVASYVARVPAAEFRGSNSKYCLRGISGRRFGDPGCSTDNFLVPSQSPTSAPCVTSDATVTVPADIAPQSQSAQVGDTVTWSCTVRNSCGTTRGFRATWDMHLSDGIRSCTLDPPLGTDSIRCGNLLNVFPTCEVFSTGSPPAICDSRYSGKSRRWVADGAAFSQMTLTIQNVQPSDFQHSYRCVSTNFGSPRVRSISVSLSKTVVSSGPSLQIV